MSSLDETRERISPRFNRRQVGLPALTISIGVIALFVALLAMAFVRMGLFTWSVGLAYIGYDTALLAFVAVKSRGLRRPLLPAPPAARRPTLGVIIAAHNEAGVIEATVRALLAQSDPPDRILIADDGSSDATPLAMRAAFGMETPPLSEGVDAADLPVRWLRLRHGGKARALNAAIPLLDTDVVVTIDADTLLHGDAIAAMRTAFVEDPKLVAATGVLRPICDRSIKGRIFQWFQTYEYVRNFLSRYAWMRHDSLLLISGAFAGFDRQALVEVGGFDPDTMTEDYELIHRLHRFGIDHGRGWTVRAIGGAIAWTDSPASTIGFLRQRRRWFAGFLQSQYWNRDMIANRRYGRLGTTMLPVKAMDTIQPIFGLAAFAVLIALVASGRLMIALPIVLVMLAKVAIDLAFLLWSLGLYRNWTGEAPKAGPAIVAAALEPFSFQLLRHAGAALGWWVVLTGDNSWGKQVRGGIRDRIATETR